MKFAVESIVVDADVGFAAGGSEHPTSKNSRLVLQAILENNFRVVFCKALAQEWKVHASIFSKTWLASMVSRKRFVMIDPEDLIASVVLESGLSESKINAALKDAHVVNAALASDRFLASNDKKAREIFSDVAKLTNKLNDLVWAVPCDDCEDIQLVLTKRGYVPRGWNLINP